MAHKDAQLLKEKKGVDGHTSNPPASGRVHHNGQCYERSLPCRRLSLTYKATHQDESARSQVGKKKFVEGGR